MKTKILLIAALFLAANIGAQGYYGDDEDSGYSSGSMILTTPANRVDQTQNPALTIHNPQALLQSLPQRLFLLLPPQAAKLLKKQALETNR